MLGCLPLPSTAADGQTMVSIISAALKTVADDQAAVVEDVCHSNATVIAHTVAELEQMHQKVEDVKAALLAANAGMQSAGHDLVSNVQHVDQLQEVQENLQQAAAAVQAAQAVLEQCLIAGELIGQQQLYPALCMLEKIRRKHLGETVVFSCGDLHACLITWTSQCTHCQLTKVSQSALAQCNWRQPHQQ